MEYLAGNIEAVKGELNNASTTAMQYDAGEIEAVRSIVQGNVDANKIYSCGGSIGRTALLAAMTGYTPTPTPTPGGGSDDGSVTSKTYAELAANRKMFGSTKMQAINATILTTGGTSVQVKAVDNGNNTVTVYPQTYYIDSQTAPLTAISQAFDLYMDENGYLKIIIGSTENFVYINSGKTVKVAVTNITNDDAHTPRTSLYTDLNKTYGTALTFKAMKSDGTEVCTVAIAAGNSSYSGRVPITATPVMYTNKISTSGGVTALIYITTKGYNFKVENSQLTLYWNDGVYPLYFDKVTTADGAHTQPITCDYLEIV